MVYSPQTTQAQRIEQDSTGQYYACTNYNLHLQQKQAQETKKFLIYTGILVGASMIIYSVNRYHYNDQYGQYYNTSFNQYGYAMMAVAGACLVVGLYKWDVKLRNDAGL